MSDLSEASIPANPFADVETNATNATPASAPAPVEGRLDLDGIERDLADVEVALRRLDSGEYWTDEVTGASIPDEHLADHPTARRLSHR